MGLSRRLQNALQAAWPPVVAVLAALLVGALLMLVAGASPIAAYSALFRQALTTYFGFADTLTKTTPLLLASLGVLVALRAGQFNLGAEGQLYMGGLGSLLVGLAFPDWPIWIHLPLALLGGFSFGAAWSAIAGYLKVARGLNEVLTTLLLNYVAQYLISYLVNGPLKADNAPSPFSELVAASARLPTILPKTQAHAGIFLGLAIAILLTAAFALTPWGYQVDAVGQNPIAARYAGISTNRTLLSVMAISGGLAGLAGSSEVLGLKRRLFENFSPGYGFDALAIALLSRGNPAAVILTSFFFGAIRSGANVMQRSASVPVSIIYAIQGLIVLFVAISLTLDTQSKVSLFNKPIDKQES
ncbi:amino acid or sugar ABC transport system, permease protein, putative [Synechococcus sp. PCC 7335]|uniref:ABC transporter permease n=1 Tax=Synechococcus sp. (strain ATCC 29403 / PCC 7335) TaxID=91464 RepID=UPI00017ED5DE|nr:ABC transporter permease [Synechococcus sp. PCC 7335]EDX87176.1 amino acid or sugar ABC transport system, permease protein, putative [Synechococcus sp. PCC 7335]